MGLVLNFQLQENDTVTQYFTVLGIQFLRVCVILQIKLYLGGEQVKKIWTNTAI